MIYDWRRAIVGTLVFLVLLLLIGRPRSITDEIAPADLPSVGNVERKENVYTQNVYADAQGAVGYNPEQTPEDGLADPESEQPTDGEQADADGEDDASNGSAPRAGATSYKARAGSSSPLLQMETMREHSSLVSVLPVEGGWLAAGYLEYNNVLNDMIIAKYDDDLSLLWTAKNSILGVDYINKLVELEDGYLVAGYTVDNRENYFSTGFMFKLSPDGELLWTKEIAKDDFSTVICGGAAVEGGFVLSGYLEMPDDEEQDSSFLAMYDLDGEELWNKCEPGYLNEIENAGDRLLATGALGAEGSMQYAALELGFEGGLLARTPIVYTGTWADDGGYMQSLGNKYFAHYGGIEGKGLLSLIGADGRLLWECQVEEPGAELYIYSVALVGDELVFIGAADNDDWWAYKGLIGRVRMDGTGLTHLVTDAQGIYGFNEVAAHKDGVVVAGAAKAENGENMAGILAVFRLEDF